jgi:pimeloyl-ACP methyl ester carboxylesterase
MTDTGRRLRGAPLRQCLLCYRACLRADRVLPASLGLEWNVRCQHISAQKRTGRKPPIPEVQPSAYAAKFTGRYEHRTITGGIGHNLPQEAPQAFAQAVIDVDRF